MKKILLILVFLITGFGADGATRPSPRGGNTQQSATQQSATANTSATQSARAARSATNARAARTPATPSPVQTTSTGTRTTITSAPSAARAASNAVVSRAAKQSVISTGTKVASAAQNTVVDEKCWNGFMGCMDSFCMLDNANGGRCICSDKNAEYDSILAEIQSLDEQSYQMATVGVERIEMGDDANAIMKKTQEITKSIEKDSAQSKRKSLDLSAWNLTEVDFDADVEDIFSLASDGTAITNKTGDALYRAAAKLCNAQIPECKSQATMMELMYKQRVRSDCTAYENSLRQQRTQSAQKLATAQSAMREAALEQYRSANKYDLGQCTVQFKQCMQTTGGCGDDFTGCVEYSVREGMVRGDKTGKTKTIKGTFSQIKLSAETYDVLESKKELCMSVTQQCVNVRDQVWDTFLREVAPQVKSAELIVESNKRTSCISNISACFQKACKDNMDPNDPDGSYDMCLTRPETLRSACKVEIDPCEGAIPNIMEYVTARLASMRVDSCTREFKQCLTSEDRCGADYTQCVGLNTKTIVEMCPRDKLVGCYNSKKPDADVYDELAEIATGIFLSIDNNMLSACQKAVQSKVLEVCGSLSECDAFADDDVIGTDSLITYKNSAGDTVIDGLMNFGLLEINETGTDLDKSNYSLIYDNNGRVKSGLDQTKQRIVSSINIVANKAAQKLAIINTDETIKTCVEGRSQSWRKDGSPTAREAEGARFPNLLKSYNLMIFNSALDKAYLNYRTKYDEYLAKALEDQSDDVKSTLCAAVAYNEGSAYCTEYEATDGDPVCTAFGVHGALEDIFNTATATTSTSGSMSATVRGSSDIGTSGLSDDGLRYIVKGADMAKKLQNMSKGKGEFIQTDADGNMIGKISMTSVYNSGTNTCNVTTTSTLCKNLDTIITTVEAKKLKGDASMTLADGTTISSEVYTKKDKTSAGLDIGVIGYRHKTKNKASKIKNVKAEVYHGTYCAEFQEPVIISDDIKM